MGGEYREVLRVVVREAFLIATRGAARACIQGVGVKTSVVALAMLAGLAGNVHAGRVFFQDFTNSTDWASYQGAGSNCFNAFIVSSGGNPSNQYRIADEALEASRTNYVSWALCRLTDLNINSYAQYEIELNIATVEQASAGAMHFYFGDGLHSNANSEVTSVLAMKFAVETLPGNRFRAYHGVFSSPTNSGRVKLTVIVNSSGGARNYTDPLGVPQTVDGGKVDVWFGDALWIDELNKIKATVTPREFKIHSQSGFAVTRFETISVYNSPPGEENVYVWANSAENGPGEEWSNAYHTIQGAIEAAPTGAVIVVTNGVYDLGGRPAPGSLLTNRLCVTNAVAVRSVNGAAETFIVGGGPFGPAAVRGVYLGGQAELIGFTVLGGHTHTNGDTVRDQSGGGVLAEPGAKIQDCVITANVAWRDGGGVRGGQCISCLVSSNTAREAGGGGYAAQFDDSTVEYNEAGNWSGGGAAAESLLNNCVLRQNRSPMGKGGGTWRSALSSCLVSGNCAAVHGGGASESTLRDCLVVDNRADEFGGGAAACELLSCTVTGNLAVSGGGAWSGSLTNCVVTGNRAETGGGVSFCESLSGCLVIGNAATFGGGAWESTLSNCQLIANEVLDGAGGGAATSRLVNCFLSGNWARGDSVGGGVCGGELEGCVLEGNTSEGAGGGAYNAVLTQCLLTNNAAVMGGGAATGTLSGCTLAGNRAAQGGGAWGAILSLCQLTGNQASDAGGGVYGGRLQNCRLAGNAAGTGGGAAFGALFNCLLTGNRATNTGGGAAHAQLYGCTIAANESGTGGGLGNGTAVNCIIYGNISGDGLDHAGSELRYCRALPQASGPGNMTNDPCFLAPGAGDYRLSADSPCIGAGSNECWMTEPGCRDMAGLPRVVGETVDLGAFEYPYTASGIHASWLEQYGLPLDGSVDGQDVDADGFSTWQEWRAGTGPTNGQSRFQFLWNGGGPPSGRVLRWPSLAGRTYAVDRTQDLMSPGLDRIASGVPGRDGFTTYTDTTANASQPSFYRVAVEE